jgi:hypothetical protein
MTGNAFRACVEQFLVPTLSPGDVVVTDNLAAHKLAGIQAAIAASILYLPPYSPDLNPIEQMLGTPRLMLRISFAHAHAKLKTLLRKASARTREMLWTPIGQLLHTFSPTKCQNYLIHSVSVRGLSECAGAVGGFWLARLETAVIPCLAPI